MRYRCDWCGLVDDAERDNTPDGWRLLDSLDFEDDVCPTCASAAKTLLDGAKAARKAGIPVPTEPTTGKE